MERDASYILVYALIPGTSRFTDNVYLITILCMAMAGQGVVPEESGGVCLIREHWTGLPRLTLATISSFLRGAISGG